jgi:hypothetical protein
VFVKLLKKSKKLFFLFGRSGTMLSYNNGRRDNFAVRLNEGDFPAYIINNQYRYVDLIFTVTDEYLTVTRFARAVARIRGLVYRFVVGLIPKCLERPLVLIRQKLNFK